MWRALQRKVRSLGAALDGKQKAQLQAAHTNWQASGASAAGAASSSQDGAPYDDADDAAGVDAAASAEARVGAGATVGSSQGPLMMAEGSHGQIVHSGSTNPTAGGHSYRLNGSGRADTHGPKPEYRVAAVGYSRRRRYIQSPLS